MVDLGRKADLGRLERIIGREAYREEENTAGVGGVALCIRLLGKIEEYIERRPYRTHNRRLPLKHVVTSWSSTA